MTETIQTTSGTNQTTASSGDGLRWLGFGALIFLCLALIAGVEFRSLQHAAGLERALAEARPASFLVGLRLREGLEQLSGAMLRFELSGDPAERSRFDAAARELSDLLSRAQISLLTARERQLAGTAGKELEQLLTSAAPLMAESRRGIRRDTAEEVQREIQTVTAPLSKAVNQLAEAQEEAASAFFAEAQQSLRSLRHWLLGSVVMFIVLWAALALLGYRALVTPLRLRLTESQALIERQERLASLGALTAGVAHEIRNPLAAIKFRLYSLRRSLSADQADNEDLAIIDGEIQRLERIVQDFLQFARPSEPKFQAVSVPSVLEGVRDLLHNEIQRRGLQLEITPGEALSVRADPQQLQQVLINLIQNAAEATPAGGRIALSARAGAARRARRAEPVVMIEVADSGRGLAPEHGARIFDPFFSTKEGGTGLGLPMAARLVEMQGGFLQYASQPNRGTTFTIVLPREHHESR